MPSKKELERRVFDLENAFRFPSCAKDDSLGEFYDQFKQENQHYRDLYLSLFNEHHALLKYLGLESVTLPESKVIRKIKKGTK